MAGVKQSRVRSGFDVEALLGERYLQMLMGTALDAGIIPSEAVFSSTTIVIAISVTVHLIPLRDALPAQ